ncbi:MAG: ABC transporter ATP-binding protein [Clostridia bacterium]|nr:ABC transporter ATP-binding protein [Clostridia bacterium]
MGAIIKIKDLNKQFSFAKGLFAKGITINAVQDLTLDINEGEILGLIGESGSGKTTLARTMLGLTMASGGHVDIDGTEVVGASKRNLRKVREQFAVVFQDPASNLNPRQTVESSIIRPLIIRGMSKAEAKEKAKVALANVQMDLSYLGSYPHQLSGGQQQRIAIARALVMDPKVMILDEPTSALDISVQAQILNLLLELQEKLNLTYVIITHDLNVIRYVSDRIAVMYMGRLVEYGSVDDVLEDPRHPYTEILIHSVPVMNPEDRGSEKQIFPGEPGDVPEDPKACRLAKRCPYVMEKCLHETPEMTEIGPGHFAECFLINRKNTRTEEENK